MVAHKKILLPVVSLYFIAVVAALAAQAGWRVATEKDAAHGGPCALQSAL